MFTQSICGRNSGKQRVIFYTIKMDVDVLHKGLRGDSYLQNKNMLGDRASNIPQIILFLFGILS